jgi:hypothetical protein
LCIVVMYSRVGERELGKKRMERRGEDGEERRG